MTTPPNDTIVDNKNKANPLDVHESRQDPSTFAEGETFERTADGKLKPEFVNANPTMQMATSAHHQLAALLDHMASEIGDDARAAEEKLRHGLDDLGEFLNYLGNHIATRAHPPETDQKVAVTQAQ